MTTQFATQIMPASTIEPTHPTLDTDRKGVNNVALFELLRSRPLGRRNLPPERSEIEKALLRESADQRRQQLADNAAVLAALYGIRMFR